ncbi:MAG: NlpC/P60 family protein [Clostridiaceae bacterium]|nr:NlpC/P60 family protein [Eubacteriales bacterium]
MPQRVKKRATGKHALKKRLKALALPAAAAAIALLALFTLLRASARRGAASTRGEYAPLSREEIEYALTVDPPADEARKALVDAATSLVGRVSYFWGGKSTEKGIDPEWGEIKEVTSPGSRTTGTLRPYGLDCSGFVLWCFAQLGYGADEAEALVGIGTWMQWERSYDIAWEALKPGDLAFENRYPDSSSNHVGICVGYGEEGRPVFVHCSSKYDGVVATPAGGVFRYARRPFLFYAEEKGLSP